MINALGKIYSSVTDVLDFNQVILLPGCFSKFSLQRQLSVAASTSLSQTMVMEHTKAHLSTCGSAN